MVQYNANPSFMSGSGSGSGLGFLVRRQRSAVSPFRGFLIFGWNMTFLNASVGDVVIMQEGENPTYTTGSTAPIRVKRPQPYNVENLIIRVSLPAVPPTHRPDQLDLSLNGESFHSSSC